MRPRLGGVRFGPVGASVVWVVLVLSAQVETATPSATGTVAAAATATRADALDALLADIGEVPLSDSELALLASLEPATATVTRTATLARPAPGVIRPAYEATRRERIETVARSTRESLEAIPSPAVGFRMMRSRVLYEGLLLPPFAEGLLDADVRTFGRVTLAPSASRWDQADGAAGTIALEGVVPAAGLSLETSAAARSTDRSAGVYAALEGGADFLAGRASVSYQDVRSLRTPDGASQHGRGRRLTASGRAVALGRPSDVVRISLGADLDRGFDTRIVDPGGAARGVAPLDQRLFTFGRLDVGLGDTWGLSALGGYIALDQRQELDGVAELNVNARLLQGRFLGFVRPVEAFSLRVGGRAAYGEGEAPDSRSRRELEVSLFADLDADVLLASAGARVTHQQFRFAAFGRDVEALRVLPQADLFIALGGPFGLRGGFAMGTALPGAGLLARSSLTPQEPETTRTVEGGPAIRGPGYWLDLTGFVSWIDDPLTFTPDATPTTDASRLRVAGVELEGAWAIGAGFEAAWSGQLAEAVDRDRGTSVGVAPLLSGVLSLRYAFGVREAFVELRGRGATSPFVLVGTRPAAGYTVGGRNLRGFFKVALVGGLALGAGFHLHLALENATDDPYQLHTRDVPGPGIDLRANLSWRY